MSTCARCGATFACAMAEGSNTPCWCTQLPPVLPVPAAGEGGTGPAGCWCRACLEQHIAQQTGAAPGAPAST